MTDDAARRRGATGRARKVVPIILAVLLLGAAGWVIGRGLLAKGELESLAASAARLEEAVQARDLADVDTTVREIATHADRAAALTSDPLWRATEVLPGVGPNTAAIRLASAHARDLADAAVPVLGIFRDHEASPGLDLSILVPAQEPLAALASAFRAADAELGAVRIGDLVEPIADGLGRLRTVVADGAGIAAGIDSAAQIAPGMLGLDGARHILLMMQNPAELRTGGGLTGTFALLTAASGELSLSEQIDSAKFRHLKEAIHPIPSSTTELYGDAVGRFVQNASMTADFDLTAALVTEWWQTYSDVDVDAIISIDPRVLSALLAATGPVLLPGGTQLTAENLVQVMLVDPYLTLSGPEQTRVQRAATTAVFERVLGGGIDLFTWAAVLAEPIEEGRVALWSAHAAEQRVLADSVVAGPLARHRAAGDNAYAVYFNDITTGKMDSYLDVRIVTGTARCRTDALTEVAVTVTLTSLAPREARTFPMSMTGAYSSDVAPGDIATLVTVAAPSDAVVGGVWDGERVVLSTNVEDNGFPSTAARVTVAPGETKSLEFRFTVPDDDEPVLLHTPLLSDVAVGTAAAGCR